MLHYVLILQRTGGRFSVSLTTVARRDVKIQTLKTKASEEQSRKRQNVTSMQTQCQ